MSERQNQIGEFDFGVREATAADLPAILTMNNTAVPAVNELSAAALEHLYGQAESLLVAEGPSSRVLGFLLLLSGPGADYESINYQWFSARYDNFLYVDRIVIAGGFRSNGLGSTLYQAGCVLGEGRFPMLCAEVNTQPRNEGSLRFHDRHGFGAVGEQDTEGGTKRVVLLSRPL